MRALFKDHIAILQKATEAALVANSCPGLVLAAGAPIMKFEDDMPYTFIANHHFRHWCPLKGSNHAVIIRPSRKPLLLAYEPADYWHAVSKVGADAADEFWVDEFEIQTFAEIEEIWKTIQTQFAGFSLHGNESFAPESIGLNQISERLLANLNWQRSFKSEFEIACLREASIIGARGHRAARKAFLEGESEFGIHLAFLKAMELGEEELPYTPIIGLNANASILHYHWKDKKAKNGNVLLIDAGAQFNDYASDITRTHANHKTNHDFTALIESVNQAQLRLCDAAKPGLNNRDLNDLSRIEMSKILVEHEIIQGISPEAFVAENLIFDFYPHGIGHPLGIHVHDVGGYQASKDGGLLERTAIDGSLRSLRTLEVGNYQTIEPGIYFIEILLAKRRASAQARHYNWKLIESLKPSGGIRIEDNVLITETGHRNLTRESLGDLPLKY